MDKMIVESGAVLKGEVIVSGAKNAALPILFATSPLVAILSAPTMTALMFPSFIKCPAILSVIMVQGILSFMSSQSVSRDPCR